MSASAARSRTVWVVVLVIVACAVVGLGSHSWWCPWVSQSLDSADEEESDDPHAHDEAGDSITLSEQARKNIGLSVMTIAPSDFDHTVTMPAVIVERPGRTQIKVSAPTSGVVTRIYPICGEAVAPGDKLFDLRLTHEDLVTLQGEFLQTVEQLAVIEKEVARLVEVTSSGAVAGKSLLERRYEQRKTEALLHSQQEALILHGLPRSEVEGIRANRVLLPSMTVFAPEPAQKMKGSTAASFLQVSKVEVEQSQQVTAGQPLCVLTNHAELYIEGKAFEEDAERLNEATKLGLPIEAVIQGGGNAPNRITGLKILYVQSQIELASRSLRFYVRLPNELIRDQLIRDEPTDERRFIAWRYKPGQRVELLVPVERLNNCIVLPVDAVVNEGAEWFVFQQNGDRFDRLPIHVEYRDQGRCEVVIENDGTLFPGDVVAATGAYDLQRALKNQAGGGVDPHAGHSH